MGEQLHDGFLRGKCLKSVQNTELLKSLDDGRFVNKVLFSSYFAKSFYDSIDIICLRIYTNHEKLRAKKQNNNSLERTD